MKQPTTMQAGPVRGFKQTLQDVPKHWIGPPTWGQLLDTSHHWLKYRDLHAAELVLHTIAHQLKEAQQAANDESHLQYKEWLKQGEAKGLRGLFRSLKSSELAWERPYRQVPPEDRMTQRLHDWGQLWTGRCNSPAPQDSPTAGLATTPQTLPGDGGSSATPNSTTNAHGHHASQNQYQRATYHAHIPAIPSLV